MKGISQPQTCLLLLLLLELTLPGSAAASQENIGDRAQCDHFRLQLELLGQQWWGLQDIRVSTVLLLLFKGAKVQSGCPRGP